MLTTTITTVAMVGAACWAHLLHCLFAPSYPNVGGECAPKRKGVCCGLPSSNLFGWSFLWLEEGWVTVNLFCALDLIVVGVNPWVLSVYEFENWVPIYSCSWFGCGGVVGLVYGCSWSGCRVLLICRSLRVCLVIVFCFCSQKVVFTLFSNFGFKYCFLPVSIHLFLYGDCFQQRVFLYNCHLFHSLHIYFIPSLSHSHHWTRESHDDHSIEGVSTRESHPMRATKSLHWEPPEAAVSCSQPDGARSINQRHCVASLARACVRWSPCEAISSTRKRTAPPPPPTIVGFQIWIDSSISTVYSRVCLLQTHVKSPTTASDHLWPPDLNWFLHLHRL